MTQIGFSDDQSEADYKEDQLRDPADAEEVKRLITHKKRWLDTCDECFKEDKEELHTLLPQDLEVIYARDEDWSKRTPIAVLLPELLIEVFRFLMEDYPPRIQESWNASFSEVIMTPHLGWILVTHVCRRWRAIAIGAAVLWTDFCHGAVLGPLWTQQFMSRAKAAPITIRRFDDYPRSMKMLCYYIVQHSLHIRHLTVSADWTWFYLVDQVSFTFSSMMVSADLDAGISHYMAPPLFGGYAPNLRRLKLTNVIPWKCINFLKHLLELDVFLCSSLTPDIDSGDPDPILVGILPSISQALDVLDEAPVLQHLALHYAFPSDDLPTTDLRRVYLNHIQELSLSAKISDCVSFFTRVIIPCNAILDLTCIPGLYTEKFHNLFCILTDRLASQDINSSIISRLEVGTGKLGNKCLFCVYTPSHGSAVQTFRISSRDAMSQECGIPSKPFITLSLAYATAPQHIVVLRKFFAIMPLYDLSYLAIYGCWHVDPHGWRAIIKDSSIYLHSVRFLVLGQDCAQYFFHAIHDEKSSATELYPLALPGLDTLVLRNVNISMFSYTLDEASFQDQMLYDLRDRARRGSKLRVLYFISCQGIAESWVTSLKEVVRFVVSGF